MLTSVRLQNKYRAMLQQAIDDYIQFYNNERYQERLNGLSPLEYRVQAA
ncbi:IS3 family transposase [Brevibacillus laterosporus]|nr:IS3 family transposase [Brevibacillus laterosporus]